MSDLIACEKHGGQDSTYICEFCYEVEYYGDEDE